MKNPTKNKIPLSKRFKSLLLILALLTSLSLAGCSCNCNKSALGSQIYQPTILRALPNQTLKTCDGIYTTHGDNKCGYERLYSEQEYLRVVELLNYK